MINIIKKMLSYILGVHFCTQYTKWEKKRANGTMHNPFTGNSNSFTEIYQERHCTECNKIHQSKLSYL